MGTSMAMFPSDDVSSDAITSQPTLERLQSRSQVDFDLEFFGRILSRAPEFVDVLRCQGELLTRKGLHDDALRVDRHLARLLPDDCIVRYNLACSLALVGETVEAIDELRAAFERGYNDLGHLEIDSDLDGLRELPEFQLLLDEFGLDN
ncbi:MAG: hypothetical protein KF708_06190 [Pirellulales bacterium]|nr:hypothetical protein [Pirellulales bacterium]